MMNDRERMHTVFHHERVIAIKFFKQLPVRRSSSRLSSFSLCSPLRVNLPRQKSLSNDASINQHTTFTLLSSLPSITFFLAYILYPPLTFYNFNILLFLLLLLTLPPVPLLNWEFATLTAAKATSKDTPPHPCWEQEETHTHPHTQFSSSHISRSNYYRMQIRSTNKPPLPAGWQHIRRQNQIQELI